MTHEFNSLTTAHKTRLFELTRNVERWAEDRNLIDGATPQAQMLKLIEEVGEIAAALARGQTANIMDGIGDTFVVITIMAKQLGFTLDDAVELAWDEIKDRKGKMVNGIFIKEEDSSGNVAIKDTETIVTEGVK